MSLAHCQPSTAIDTACNPRRTSELERSGAAEITPPNSWGWLNVEMHRLTRHVPAFPTKRGI